jgi:hypothetical protein
MEPIAYLDVEKETRHGHDFVCEQAPNGFGVSSEEMRREIAAWTT